VVGLLLPRDSDARAAKVMRGGTAMVAGRVAAMILQAAFLALLARSMNDADLAAFIGGLALVTVVGIVAEFGLGQTLIVRLADEDEAARRALSSGALVHAMGTADIGGAAAAVFALTVLGTGSLVVVALLMPSMVLQRINRIWTSIAQHHLRFARVGAGEVASRVIPVAMLLAVGPSARTIGLVAVGMGLGEFVRFALLFQRHSLAAPRRADMAGLARSSVVLGLVGGSAILHSQGDQLLLAAMGTARDLNHYALAYRVPDAALALAGAAGAVAFPLLVRSARPVRAAVARTQLSVFAAIGGLIAIATYVAAPLLARAMVGSADSSVILLLRLLSPTILITAINSALQRTAIAISRVRGLLAASVASVIVNIGLNLVLIPSFGARGAAIVTGITEFGGLCMVAYLLHGALPGAWSWRQLTVPVAVVLALVTLGPVGERMHPAVVPMLAVVAMAAIVAVCLADARQASSSIIDTMPSDEVEPVRA
jgi:O-antigen/teichoic acid export membrane protein